MNTQFSKGRSIAIAALAIIALLAIDFFSKRWALNYLRPIGNAGFIPGFLELQYVENRGAAFGILSGRLLPVIIITPIIVILVFYIYIKSLVQPRLRAFRIVCILFISGSLGNFIDRIAYGYVVDFFNFLFIRFPVFNVADIYLTVSTFLLLLLMLFYYRDEDWEFMKGKGRLFRS